MSEKVTLDVNEELKKLATSLNGLTSQEAATRLEKYGRNELEEVKVSQLLKLLLTFWGPIPWMIEIAAVLSLVIQHWPDFWIITFMLVLNAAIEFIQESKAHSALQALKDSMALKARTKRDGEWKEIDASTLVPGDIVNLANGDIVPADMIAAEGKYIAIDQAALTGESLPVNKLKGDEGYAGSIVKQGDMNCLVTKTGGETFFGKTAALVQSAGNVSHFQLSVLAIGKFLIYGSFLFAILIIAKELFMHANPMMIVELVLVLVIASIPVAMPAVLSVTMALGALALSKQKAIVSNLQAIEEMAAVDILCSDKTGTLTKNELTLYEPILYAAKTKEELNLWGGLASNLEGKDAIDSTIVAGADPLEIAKYEQLDFIPFDPVSKKTEGLVKDASGKEFKVTKGAPHVIIDLCDETNELKEAALKTVHDLAVRGLRALGVAKEEAPGKFKLSGILSLFDPPREDSKSTIAEAKEYGVDVRMVTGDDIAIAKEISGDLGLGTDIKVATEIFAGIDNVDDITRAMERKIVKAEGFARVFPEHKYAIVKALQDRGYIIAMTGDGVNDSPALKQADIGIAVDGATDAARAAADLILTKPGLSVITNAIEEARKIFERMISYITYRVAMTINIMIFVTLSILFTNIVPVTAFMIVLIALLDDIPIMAIAYDNTDAEKDPVKWEMFKLLSISSILGFASVIQAFIILFLAKKFGFNMAHIQTVIFLELVVGGHLLLFVSRHKSWFWTRPWPSAKLLIAIFGTQIFAVYVCRYGFFVTPISWTAIGLIWLYCLLWMFILCAIRIAYEKSADPKNINGKFAHLNKRINRQGKLNDLRKIRKTR